MSVGYVHGLFKSWFPKKDIDKSVALGTAAGIGISLTDHAVLRTLKTHGFLQKTTSSAHTAFKSRSILSATRTVTTCGILIPLFEEVVYRGLAREMMLTPKESDPKTELKRKIKRVLANATLFTLPHIRPKLPPAQNLALGACIFTSGVILATLTEKTNNLWASSTAHTLSNLISLARIARL